MTLYTRTVGVPANVFEAEGLATVSLVAVRGQAERGKAPRALYCDFPLGRPLGRPLDAEYQHRDLAAAFSLLATPKERAPISSQAAHLQPSAHTEPQAGGDTVGRFC